MSTRGWEHATPADVRSRVEPTRMAKRRSKFNAVKTVVDGFTFDSKAEAARYGVLKLREKAGEIDGLVLQPEFVLTVDRIEDGEPREIGVYRGDFRYRDHVASAQPFVVVEDVKGFKTPLYRWKKKHVEAQYGIQIREIR